MKKFYTIKELKNPAGAWLLAVILSLLLTGLLAPTAVWISLDTNDMLYENRQKQAELEEKIELSNKLEIEHARLLSPYELKKKAETIGMGLANANQVRRITIFEKEVQNPDNIAQEDQKEEKFFIEIGINEELENEKKQKLTNEINKEEDIDTKKNSQTQSGKEIQIQDPLIIKPE